MLPDGLSDIELSHSDLPIDNILDCKTALIRTALAYIDAQKRLKALVPIREYVRSNFQPSNHLIGPLTKYFQELLKLYQKYSGTQKGSVTNAQLLSNVANIQNLIKNGLQPNHPDLNNSVSAALFLNGFNRDMGWETISFLAQLHHVLPDPCNHQLEAALITELFASSYLSPISNPETLVAQALAHFEHFDDSDLKCELSVNTGCMKTDINLQVNSTTLLDFIICTNRIFPLQWISVTCVYCWQQHLVTPKDTPKHYTSLHGSTGLLVTILPAKHMHVRHRGWARFLLI
jgi:hypothetical protein